MCIYIYILLLLLLLLLLYIFPILGMAMVLLLGVTNRLPLMVDVPPGAVVEAPNLKECDLRQLGDPPGLRPNVINSG